MFRRTKILGLFITFLTVCLIIRVYSLSDKNNIYAKRAYEQNFLTFSFEDDRNDILDRYDRRLTGVDINKYALAFSANDNAEDFKLAESLSKYSGCNKYDIYNSLFTDAA